MIDDASRASKESGELGRRVAFSRSSFRVWVVSEAYTPQDVDLFGDDTLNSIEVPLNYALPCHSDVLG